MIGPKRFSLQGRVKRELAERKDRYIVKFQYAKSKNAEVLAPVGSQQGRNLAWKEVLKGGLSHTVATFVKRAVNHDS